jgi:RES domain-containing protein
MTLKANLEYRALKAWCGQQAGIAVDAVFYRSAGPRFTSAQNIVSGIGGLKSNGRWCRRGIARLLYLSRMPETALGEANEHARRNNLPLWEQMPKVSVAVQVFAPSVIDLTAPATQASLPRPWAQFMADWRADNLGGQESLSQALGRAAVAAGFDGILVPSKVDPDGVNLVIFLRRRRGGVKTSLLNPDSLKALGEN